MGLDAKTCSRCNVLKPFTEYSKDYTFCKKCKREDIKNNPQYMIKQNKTRKHKWHNDPVYREKQILRAHLTQGWRRNKWTDNRIMKVLKVNSREQFERYIVSKFQDGMTLENYGSGKDNWQFDHIIPLDTAETIDEVIKLFHYTNIQPLWRDDNSTKRNKIWD